MTEKQKVLNVLGEIGVMRENLLVSGSAVMFLADIPRERPLGDIDLFVPTVIWFNLYGRNDGWRLWATASNDQRRRFDPPYLIKEMYGVDVNIFFQWRVRHIGDIDVNFWDTNSVFISGYRCVPPQLLLEWKQAVGRTKDFEDILLLRKYLDLPTGDGID